MKFRDFKKQALVSLKGNMKTSILVVLLLSLPNLLLSIVRIRYKFISLVIGILINGFVLHGFAAYFLNLYKEGKGEVEVAFSGFNKIFKTTVLNIIIMTSITIGTIFFVIPGIIMALILSQSYFIMVEKPKMKIVDILKESMKMMNGNKTKLLLLQLSFFGWIILSALSYGLGNLILTPYMEMTFCIFYLFLRGSNVEKEQLT